MYCVLRKIKNINQKMSCVRVYVSDVKVQGETKETSTKQNYDRSVEIPSPQTCNLNLQRKVY